MSERVNHPAHYNQGKIEVIEFLEDKNLDFHRANAVKYICRAGIKDPETEIEDLEKAVWYLKRKIEVLRSNVLGKEPARPNDMNPCVIAGCDGKLLCPDPHRNVIPPVGQEWT